MSLRIVTLLASATEIVCALGLRDSLLGISHECDFPASIKDLPVCSSPKFAVEGTSGEIDRKVKEVLEMSASVYLVDAKKLAALLPTHIITQVQCEVCAVSLKDVEAAACDVIPSRPQLVTLNPQSLDNIFDDIMTVGKALGVGDRAQQLCLEMKRRIDLVACKRKNSMEHPKVAFIDWIDPLLSGGQWMPTLIRLAGGVDLFGSENGHAGGFTLEDLANADPDLVVVAPCGFDVQRTAKEMVALNAKPGWSNLACVRQGRVYLCDGNQFFNRPGPRIVDSLEILDEIFDDAGFKSTSESGTPVRHRGTDAWIKYDS